MLTNPVQLALNLISNILGRGITPLGFTEESFKDLSGKIETLGVQDPQVLRDLEWLAVSLADQGRFSEDARKLYHLLRENGVVSLKRSAERFRDKPVIVSRPQAFLFNPPINQVMETVRKASNSNFLDAFHCLLCAIVIQVYGSKKLPEKPEGLPQQGSFAPLRVLIEDKIWSEPFSKSSAILFKHVKLLLGLGKISEETVGELMERLIFALNRWPWTNKPENLSIHPRLLFEARGIVARKYNGNTRIKGEGFSTTSPQSPLRIWIETGNLPEILLDKVSGDRNRFYDRMTTFFIHEGLATERVKEWIREAKIFSGDPVVRKAQLPVSPALQEPIEKAKKIDNPDFLGAFLGLIRKIVVEKYHGRLHQRFNDPLRRLVKDGRWPDPSHPSSVKLYGKIKALLKRVNIPETDIEELMERLLILQALA